MNNPLDIQNVGSITSYFNPILEICENKAQSVQDVALPALQALVHQVQTAPTLSLSSIETLANQTKELQETVKTSSKETMTLIVPEIEKIFISLDTRLPHFRFDPYIYNNPNNPLPSTYFEDESKKAVGIIFDKIRDAVQNDTISECFLESFETLRGQRQEIAKKQNTENPLAFGEPRYEDAPEPGRVLSTPFSSVGPYLEHRYYFLRNLSSLIAILSKKNSLGEVKTPSDIPIQGYTSSYTIECFNKVPLQEHTVVQNYSGDELKMLTTLSLMRKNLFIDPSSTFSSTEENDLHKNKKSKTEALAISAIDDFSASFIYIKESITKNNISYPLSTYFIFVKKEDYENKNFVSNNTELVIIHQDPQEIKRSLKEVEDCFVKCVTSTTEDELKENMAVFRYLLAHIAPCRRGSAWVAESLEKAIYQYKGYEFSYGLNPTPSRQRSLADLDALSNLCLSQFKRTYLLQANLKKMRIKDE
ncbi:MAG: hypothetical protein V4489_06330 [Chlamydiota bacterium]